MCLKDLQDSHRWWKRLAGYGKIHRDGDQPAVVHAIGGKEWYQRGKLHRDGDQPAVVHANGYKAWYQHGERMPEPSSVPVDS